MEDYWNGGGNHRDGGCFPDGECDHNWPDTTNSIHAYTVNLGDNQPFSKEKAFGSRKINLHVMWSQPPVFSHGTLHFGQFFVPVSKNACVACSSAFRAASFCALISAQDCSGCQMRSQEIHVRLWHSLQIMKLSWSGKHCCPDWQPS